MTAAQLERPQNHSQPKQTTESEWFAVRANRGHATPENRGATVTARPNSNNTRRSGRTLERAVRARVGGSVDAGCYTNAVPFGNILSQLFGQRSN